MSPRLKIPQAARRIGRASGHGAGDEGLRDAVVPALRGGGPHGGEQADERKANKATRHRRGISGRLGRAATAAAVALAALGCEDVMLPGGGTVATADLIALPLQPGAPAVPSATFYVYNSKPVSRLLSHTDQALNPYLRIDFPAGCLSSLNGQQLTVNDSVLVTVTPLAGGYGLTLSPSGLEFTLETPVATFSYGRYADASVADGTTYPDRTSYLAALDVWEEVTVDRWRVARASGSAGVDQIAAAVDKPGELLVAAAR